MSAHLARRLLASAALLLAAAATACDSPTHADDPAVIGQWEGASPAYPVVWGDSVHHVKMHAEFTFRADGTYDGRELLVDADRGLVIAFIDASGGHYTARDGKMVLLHEEEIVRDPDSPYASASPTLVAVTPHPVRYNYQVNGSVMLLGVECPPDADCIPPLPPLQRIPQED